MNIENICFFPSPISNLPCRKMTPRKFRWISKHPWDISPTRLCLKTLSEPGTPFFGPKIYHLFVVDLRNSIIEHGHLFMVFFLWTCHPIIIKYQFCPIELSPFSNTQATLGPVPWREWRHDALSAWQVSWRMDSYERHQTNSYILRIVWQPTK